MIFDVTTLLCVCDDIVFYPQEKIQSVLINKEIHDEISLIHFYFDDQKYRNNSVNTDNQICGVIDSNAVARIP